MNKNRRGGNLKIGRSTTTRKNPTPGAPKKTTAGGLGTAGDHHAGGKVLPPAVPNPPGVNTDTAGALFQPPGVNFTTGGLRPAGSNTAYPWRFTSPPEVNMLALAH